MSRRLESDTYRFIVESIQDIVWFGTIDGACEYVSPSLTSFVGYTCPELMGVSICEFFHPHDLVHLNEHLAKVKNRIDVGMMTCRLRHKNGRYLWFDFKFTPISDEVGEVVRMVGIGRDITDRKRMEDRIARAERMAHVGSWERDVLNNQLYWSAEMYRIFGLDASESLTLQQLFRRIHPDDLPRVNEAIQRANDGHPYAIQYRIVRPGGEIRFVHALGEVVREEGGVTKVMGSLQDITERKQAGDHLLRSKEELKLAQRIAHLGHWNWDVARNDLYWSDEVYRIFGLSQHDRTDNTMESFFAFVHPEDRDYVKQCIVRALQGAPCDAEFRAVLPDQSNRVVHVLGETDFDDRGHPVHLFGTVQDITDQRQTEEMLRTSEKLALAGQMSAGIAHEIRNPLTVLKGFIKLMEQSTHGNHEEQHFAIIQSELNRIESIASELLVFARPHAVQFAPHDIRTIMEEVITFIRMEALLKNVHVELECAQVEMMVTSECNQLKQVFINLAKNAIEAMPNGGTLCVKITAMRNSVLVQFIDEGSGIPADQIARLGEPFYSTKEGGTGLGLMVSQKIIHAHHGTINISSEVGKGTTVTLSLPILSAALSR